MNNEDIAKLHFLLPISKSKVLDQSKEYFSKLHDHFVSQNNNWTISNLFHTALGYKLIYGQKSKDFIGSINNFLIGCEKDAGFLPTTKDHPLFLLMKKSLPKPDIYSSYYALLLSRMFNIKISEDSIGTLVMESTQPSGWIYSTLVSDTDKDRRFHSELALQTLFGVKVLSILGINRDLDSTLNSADVLFNETKYMGVKADLLEIQYLIKGKIEMNPTKIKNILDFLESHYSKKHGGFYEYLFEEVKIDEITKRTQRFSHDYLVPSIPATYSAVKIISMLYDNKDIENFFVGKVGEIKNFFYFEPSENSFGNEIKIARFKATVGGKTSPQETLMRAASLDFISSNE